MAKIVKDKLESKCATVIREKDTLEHVINCAKNIHIVYLDRDFNFVKVNQVYAETGTTFEVRLPVQKVKS